jgi:hypothetical protein
MVFLICMLFLPVLFEGWCIVGFLVVDDLLFLLFCVFPIVVAPVFVSVLLLVLELYLYAPYMPLWHAQREFNF